MFWRSVVGKLAVTILLLVSFVLFILTILLLEFFENFHVQEAEKAMMQTAKKISYMLEQYDDKSLLLQTVERVKDPASRVAIVFKDDEIWMSDSTDPDLIKLKINWFKNEASFADIVTNRQNIHKQIILPNNDMEALIVGTPLPLDTGAVYVYQSLEVIEQTKAETTKIIYLAAGIAIILTTIFAFFLSTRITKPLISMREAAFDLTRGEFDTKVPILAYDEIGELGMAFNRMGRQLKFHLNALRQEKEQLSSIVLSMADGIVTLNRTGEVMISNPPADRFFEGLEFEHNIQSTNEPKQLPVELKQLLDKVIAGEKEVFGELSLQGRNWVIIMTPLYDQVFVRGAVAVIRDMTEERRMDKLRKDFIANVSHELRTPIALMQGYSEAIVDNIAESKEEKNELAQIIHDESLRMGRLVNELLDIARMEAGQVRLNTEKIDVELFIDRISKKFEGMAVENKIELSLTKNISISFAVFDPDQIEQVFTNLIDNAMRHTPEYGSVHIEIDNKEMGFYAIVADKGSGIAEEDLPFVFERFYKADKSRTRSSQQKGTGLGLSIAKNIIEAHHGIISVKSKLNIGTSFIFNIPKLEEIEHE